MNNLTYTEAIAHVRKYKAFYSLKHIAEQINMSPAYFRNIINELYGLSNLPEKNRTDFVRVVSGLCMRHWKTPEQEELSRLSARAMQGYDD